MPENLSNSEKPLRSYGRRRVRKLRRRHQELMETLLPKVRIDLSAVPDSLPGEEVWLEIGFGGGEHLAGQAQRYPEAGFIGCEPFENGVASLLTHMDDHNLHNIRIWDEDARDLLAALPDHSLQRIFILFPDPWPKSRHHKRRVINEKLLEELARILRIGAELRIATDDADYARWILERVLANPAFSWQAGSKADWQQPPDDWIQTRYESKALKQGKRPFYFTFLRQS